MDATDTELIDTIRAASRAVARELGLLDTALAGPRHAPSAVQAIVEIGAEPGLTAAVLSARLDLDKSSVSRLLRKLVDGGEVVETGHADDGRLKSLALTSRGKRTLKSIDAQGRRRVAAAVAPLSDAKRRAIGAGLVAYADALEAARSR